MQVKDLKVGAFIIEGEFREFRWRMPGVELPEKDRAICRGS